MGVAGAYARALKGAWQSSHLRRLDLPQHRAPQCLHDPALRIHLLYGRLHRHA